MRYADNHCRYSEIYKPDHLYQYSGPCIMCQKTIFVDVPAGELHLYRTGELIQNAMRSLTDGQREFLISGICGSCFDNMEAIEDAPST